MDEVTWGALTLTLTLLGGIWTWFAWRNRGVASALRGAGLTMLPAAAWLTGTMEMATEIGGSVADWATHLVFSPTVWLGIILAGVSVVLLGVSGALRERGIGTAPRGREVGAGETKPRRSRKDAKAAKTGELGPGGKGKPAIDDDLADIEAILRKRGIT